jgi:hypothetical protein
MGKATGPRTVKGRARSSQNAAKHWIESRRILEAEQREAAILRKGFMEDFRPQSLIEHELIDDLVLNRLIKRRIDAAFPRESSKADVEKRLSVMKRDEHSLAHYYQRYDDEFGASGREWRKGERLRPAQCLNVLEGVRDRIVQRGPLPEDLVELRRIYGNEPTGFGARVVVHVQTLVDLVVAQMVVV